jgi:hypothetical protein
VPERLDRVVIAYAGARVTLPWASRDELLSEINHLENLKDIRHAFEAVGASRPVELTREQAILLIDTINLWSNKVSIAQLQLPADIWRLRCVLLDETQRTAK